MFTTLVTNAGDTTLDTEHSVLGLKLSLNHSELSALGVKWELAHLGHV